MDKKKTTTSSLARTATAPRAVVPKRSEEPKRWTRSTLLLWTALLLIIGIVLVSVVSLNAANLLKTVQIPGVSSPSLTPISITTLKVQHTAQYAGLDITVVNAQYALAFADDDIHQGQSTVRLDMNVANHTADQINIVYYDIARLLVPNTNPLIPTNVHLSVGPKPGTSESGWLDFSIPNKHVQLKTLTLQLGSTTLNEMLVKVPFSSTFNSAQYAGSTSPQTTTIAYNFFGHSLTYHLTSVERRFSYQGVQCKVGQQFYVLNFKVDNSEGSDISPGYGFDYIRLVFPGNERAPVYNTLPQTFKARAKRVSGSVVYAAPSGLKKLTIGLLSQNGNGEQDTNVNL